MPGFRKKGSGVIRGSVSESFLDSEQNSSPKEWDSAKQQTSEP